jgi:hypothetical protein
MNQNTYIALDLGSSHITAMAAEVLDSGAVKCSLPNGKPPTIFITDYRTYFGAAFKISELLKLLQNSAKIRVFDKFALR